jgi:hypothetical protein
MKKALLAFCFLFSFSAVSYAQISPDESEARLKALEERVRALEAEVREFRTQQVTATQLASARIESLSLPTDSAFTAKLPPSADPLKATDAVRAGDPRDPLTTAVSPQVPDASAAQA